MSCLQLGSRNQALQSGLIAQHSVHTIGAILHRRVRGTHLPGGREAIAMALEKVVDDLPIGTRGRRLTAELLDLQNSDFDVSLPGFDAKELDEFLLHDAPDEDIV